MSAPQAPPRRVCVVGSINMDLVIRAPRFPQAGETILGGSFATFPGGKGANQAVAAARIGAHVSMIGRVGDDAYGREMLRVLSAEGIDTTSVKATRDTPTGVAVITVAEDGGNTIVVGAGANAQVSPRDVRAARRVIADAEVLVVQLEVPISSVIEAASIARASGTIVVLNAAPACALPSRLLRLVDVLIVNETEAALVVRNRAARAKVSFGAPALRSAGLVPASPLATDRGTRALLGKLAALGPPGVIMTCGDKGSIWLTANVAVFKPAFRVRPVDTVGAGDAFCGAVAATIPLTLWNHAMTRAAPLWGSGDKSDAATFALDLSRCETSASAAGALATLTPGAISSLPTKRSVERFLKAATRSRSLRKSPTPKDR